MLAEADVTVEAGIETGLLSPMASNNGGGRFKLSESFIIQLFNCNYS